MRCPTCGGELTPLSSRGTLVFLCPAGHETSTEDVLVLPDGKAELAEALRAWELRLAQLEKTAAQARELSQPDVAAVFERQMEVARSRASLLRGRLDALSRG